jgi:hypothetical protein
MIGRRCAATQACVAGICACRTGLTAIAGGMGCTDLQSDPTNCGALGNRCGGATPACVMGTCRAPDACVRSGSVQLCMGACVDTATNTLHCGDCGNDCGRDEVCIQGRCRGYTPAAACSTCPCASCAGETCCTGAAPGAVPICVGGGRCA